jgi:hypothetical protein
MKHLTKSPRGASIFGTATAVIVSFAIFVLGAPPWILVPALWVGATAYIETSSWVERRLDQR